MNRNAKVSHTLNWIPTEMAGQVFRAVLAREASAKFWILEMIVRIGKTEEN